MTQLHPALWFAMTTPLVLNGYRAMPSLELALAWYAWAFVAVAIALQRHKDGIPDEAISLMVLVALASSAAAAAGDAKLARLAFGLNIVALLLIVAHVADHPFWWAYAWTGAIELGNFVLGNAQRGTFGEDVAYSAIGQAYGPWAMPLSLLGALAGYGVAWYNLKGKRA
jgi:hypothetical protein